MNKKGRKYLLGAALAVVMIWIISQAVSQPGVQDLPGNFREVAMYRNENNTGPIIRIYAVALSDTLWNEMEQYGKFMPHTKYGNTRVYFFLEDGPVPDKVTAGAENLDPALKKYCLAVYEKDAMGTVSFRKYPFL